jgi:hypothetical protein
MPVLRRTLLITLLLLMGGYATRCRLSEGEQAREDAASEGQR